MTNLKRRNKCFGVLLAVLLFIGPILAQAQERPTRDAQAQAQIDVSTSTWFIVGCLFGAAGYVAALLIIPNPPVSVLLGKSSDYVAVYTDAYKRQAKSIQSQKALTGCLIGTGLQVVALVLIIALAPDDPIYYYY
jgi:heme O synthase-like polyprenyltransferase